MRHLLIVDDEPNLVDGLCLALAENLGDDVHISKAYSGAEALDILSANPIDLLITDVRMPDISGLDLLQIIHERRMACRVLVITGHDEFNAIHGAVKLPPTAGFLLKTEGDEEIIKVVKSSLTGIEEAEKNQRSLALAERQGHALDTLLRERRLWHLLGMLPYYDKSAVFSESVLAIDVDKPLLLVVVRCFSTYFDEDNILWLEQQVNQLLSTHFSMEMSFLGPADMAWLLQECKDTALNGTIARVLRSVWLEIQSRLANNGTDISVAFISRQIQTQDLPGYVHALRNVLQNLWVESKPLQIIDVSTDEPGLLAGLLQTADIYVSGNTHIHSAKNALLQGDAAEWEAALFSASRLNNSDPSVMPRLLSMLVATLNALGLPPIEDIPKLLSPAQDYAKLRSIGADICHQRSQASKQAIVGVIDRIHEIIKKNLGKHSLSVASIAIQTHYNPSYLSRLYKQQTGVNITETINDMRISRACSLLKDQDLKINNISQKVGFSSPSYFTFFFRKKMGMTPKEYRNGK